jgi:hypothetical protein
MVAHTCNPSYQGGRDQEDHGLRSAQAKWLQDPISVSSWACGERLSSQLLRKHKQEVMVQASAGKNARPYLQNN